MRRPYARRLAATAARRLRPCPRSVPFSLASLQARTRQKLIQLRVPFIVPERQAFRPLRADDRVPTFCLAAPALREAVQSRTIQIVPDPDEANVTIEAWAYDPRVLTDWAMSDGHSSYYGLR